ncbi:Paraquat-inducible protein A [hydrothermal vent metagenome]|uniref:Paraquat-inducible protein A n=1 Tax=hydrothermal vent metagenome TaxID=652676 RepID=A0A1W1CMY3_9ZZZZ
MKEKDLAEALCLFNKIENLMRNKGAKGESFSDLVKSFNPVKDDNKLRSCREFTKEVGHMFYFDSGNETYLLKDDYIYDEEKIEYIYRRYFKVDEDEYIDVETVYTECKKRIKNYYEAAESAMDGFYKNLKIIGHERNQLLHIYDYEITNFKKFKKACKEIINYLETGKKPFFSKTQLQHSDSYGVDDPSFFWIKLCFFALVILFGLHYSDVCHECAKKEYYGVALGATLAATLFFFPLLRIVLGIVSFILDNIIFIMIGYFLYIFVIKKYL